MSLLKALKSPRFMVAIGVTCLFAFVMGVVIPCFRSYNPNVDYEIEAIKELKGIAEAQKRYTAANARYGTLEQLRAAGYLTDASRYEIPAARGYVYTITVKQAGDGEPAFFSATADPQDVSASQSSPRPHFYIDSTNSDVRVSYGKPANVNDLLM
ncbi:MAG: DUF2781 domain-containing protein [Pyrinomonadaceae bacterium MAG19_C2-C3]|nr:DUF2781 domain-containing protein [Pyrinomonadaceae bacterium MAG19_C2-C3]